MTENITWLDKAENNILTCHFHCVVICKNDKKIKIKLTACKNKITRLLLHQKKKLSKLK
jgi:hypothetical protein